MRAAGVMQWTVRLEARTSVGEVKTTELVTFSRPGVVGTLAEIGLMLSETKTLLAKLQASMLCDQVAEYAAHHRVCAACGVLQPLKDRRTPAWCMDRHWSSGWLLNNLSCLASPSVRRRR